VGNNINLRLSYAPYRLRKPARGRWARRRVSAKNAILIVEVARERRACRQADLGGRCCRGRALPAVSTRRTGRPFVSTTACILLVGPPRDRPIDCLLLRAMQAAC
jgi:hypothetical protein